MVLLERLAPLLQPPEKSISSHPSPWGMRGWIVGLVAVAMLVPGCSSTQANGEFVALAMKAPTLLEQDSKAGGTISGASGTVTTDTTVKSGGSDMTMHMEMQMTQRYFAGDAFLIEMKVTAMTMNGGSSMTDPVTITVFCSPTRLLLEFTGMPSGSGEDPSTDMANPAGSCSNSESLRNAVMAQSDSNTASLLNNLFDQSSVPKLTFVKATTEGGKDVAVYKVDMDMGQTGMNLNMALEATATLSGPRIATLRIAGTMDMSMDMGGSSMSTHTDMDGTTTYSYGARGPIPAEYA